jgi:hypothetical protein
MATDIRPVAEYHGQDFLDSLVLGHSDPLLVVAMDERPGVRQLVVFVRAGDNVNALLSFGMRALEELAEWDRHREGRDE